MFKIFFLSVILSYSVNSLSNESTAEVKKTHLEDIFIWKMSDELKLTVPEEIKFTEINKALNKKKSEINKKIQQSIQNLSTESAELKLRAHKKLIQEYNEISLAEFESIKKLLGKEKFIAYLKIKHELTTKVKSILIGEKVIEKDEKKTKALPPPKIITDRQ